MTIFTFTMKKLVSLRRLRFLVDYSSPIPGTAFTLSYPTCNATDSYWRLKVLFAISQNMAIPGEKNVQNFTRRFFMTLACHLKSQ